MEGTRLVSWGASDGTAGRLTLTLLVKDFISIGDSGCSSQLAGELVVVVIGAFDDDVSTMIVELVVVHVSSRSDLPYFESYLDDRSAAMSMKSSFRNRTKNIPPTTNAAGRQK